MDERHGARQPQRFDPARAARLDDPQRFKYLPVEEVLSLLDPPKGTRLLDFGTGTGTYAIAIAKLRPDLNIIAYDEQPEMLPFVREKLEREHMHNVHTMLRGEGDTPNAERVLALNVLHELGDQALAEICDSLVAGGRVLFIDWNADVDRPVGPPKEHVFSLAEARARLKQAGFHILEERVLTYHYAILAQCER